MLIAATRVGDLPLFLSVSMALTTVYADWRVKSLLVGGTLLVLLLTGAYLLHAMNGQQNRRITAERRELAMSEENRQDAERHHANKLEAVGRLTAGIGHDFNNYLQTITSSLEIIAADYLHDPEALEVVQLAHKAASNGAKLTQRLMTFSRQQVLQPRQGQRILPAERHWQAGRRCGHPGDGDPLHQFRRAVHGGFVRGSNPG